MKHFLRLYARLLFYISWFVLGLLQALFTELQDDEAYYWVYARYLDWGYFDHPPMIALLVKAGGWLFNGIMGVRFFPLLLNTLTLLITESFIEQKNKLLFYAICLSAGVLQIIGFWAVPDVPLLFFTALFFWCYKKFVTHTSLPNTLLFAVSCALLMYTKYHGALIILFTLFSNLQLLRRWHIYAAGTVALLLYAPHLWWQYRHDWISFRYHLFESNVNRYKFSYTIEYIAGQLLLAGPLAGIILLWSTFAIRTTSKLEKALQYTGIGIFIFFLLSSFKGKVEANWTAPALIPMLVLTHRFLQGKEGWRKWLYRLLPPTLLLVLLIRIIMIFDIVPAKAVVQRFHAWKGWPQQLDAVTKSNPLVFLNSYQRASKVWFYTGKPAYSLNSYKERRSNYNYWPIEDVLLGKPLYILDIYSLHYYPDSVQARLWKVGYRFDSSFQAFAKISLQPKMGKYTVKEGALLPLRLKVVVPDHYRTYLQQHPHINMPVKVGVFKVREWIKDIELPLTLQDIIRHQEINLPLQLQLEKGAYYLRMAVGTSTEVFTHNSDKINVTVE